MLASAAQNSAKFDRWLPWILLINISGMLTLFALLVGKLCPPGAATTGAMCPDRA